MFILSSLLQNALVYLLVLVDGVLYDGAYSVNQSGIEAEVLPVVTTHKGKVPLVSVVSQMVVAWLMVSYFAMPITSRRYWVDFDD